MRYGRVSVSVLVIVATTLLIPDVSAAQSGRRREKVAPPPPAPQEIAQPPADPSDQLKWAGRHIADQINIRLRP